MPIDPITASLLLSGGSALAGKFLGGDDEYKMSPRQKLIYDRLLKELESGDLGFSAQEKADMAEQLKTGLRTESQAATKSVSSSLQRRGMLSGGQLPGISTRIQASAGKAFGQGLTDIELASAREKRRRKSELESALMGFPEQFVPGYDPSDDLGEISGNLMELFLNKRKKPGINDEGSFSNLRAPRFPFKAPRF